MECKFMFKKALFMLLALTALSMRLDAKDVSKPEKMLQDNLRQYALAVRWNDFESAAAFLDPRVLADARFSEQMEAYYKNFEMSGYALKSAAMTDPTHYVQRVELRVIDRDTQVERVKVDKQDWRYDALSKRWWLASGLPKLD
jgi:hypothetical protein